MIKKSKETILAQLITKIIISLFFLFAIFFRMPLIFIYLSFAIILFNVVLSFINRKEGTAYIFYAILGNFLIFILAFVLLLAIIEFFAAIIGTIVSFIYLVFFYLRIYKKS